MSLEQVSVEHSTTDGKEREHQLYLDQMVELESSWFQYRLKLSDNKEELLVRLEELGLNSPQDKERISRASIEELQGMIMEDAILKGSSEGSLTARWFREKFVDSQEASKLLSQWGKNKEDTEVFEELNRLFTTAQH